MPSLALTPPGTPTTSSTGPAAIFLAEAAGTVAVTAWPSGVVEIAAGVVAPCASASPAAPEHPANVPPEASANPATSNRTTRRIRLQGLEGRGYGSRRATGALRRAPDRTMRYLVIPAHLPNPLLTSRSSPKTAIGYLGVTIRTPDVPCQPVR